MSASSIDPRTPRAADQVAPDAVELERLEIGIVYETFSTYAREPSDPLDTHVEYEPETTIELLEAAIRHLGHGSRRLGSPVEVLDALRAGRSLSVDAALNVAEGYGSRNREAWAPVLLEMAGVPTLGSDALTLSTSLDKAWTHRVVASAGVPVPAHVVLRSGDDASALDLGAAALAFPLFVKPRWEGSAKGIRTSSKVADRAGLVREVTRITRDYAQPALVEAFVPGAEYTVAVVGNDPPRALPVMQRALDRASGIGLHAIEGGEGGSDPEQAPWLPGTLTQALEEELHVLALRAWHALDCLDFARLDFRLDADDGPRLLEINPLPTFAVDGTFAILAELEGRAPAAFLAEILDGGLRRLGLSGARAVARTEVAR
jgi:D-alanine-D-alanine ligase